MAFSNLIAAVVMTTALMVVLYVLSNIVLYRGLLPLSTALPFRRLGRPLFYLLIMPGTVVHELSHYAACVLSRVRVFEVRLFDPQPNGVVGQVIYERCDPIRRNLIAFAPFVGGALALYGVAGLAFSDSLGARLSQLAFRPDDWFANLGLMIGAVLMTLRGADPGRLLTWVFLYLVFSIGYGIAPSRTDLSHLLADSVFVMTLCLIIVAADWILKLGLSTTSS